MAVRLADAPAVDALRAAFMCLLPRIEAHLAFAFRWLRCPHRRADAVQEAVALAWLGFLRAVSHGKDPSAFAGPLAGYAARRVRVGRRLSGTKSGRDALSPHAGTRHGFTVYSFSWLGSSHPALQELADNTVTPPPEQAAFRLDFPRWRAGYGARDRALIDELMAGGRTGDVAARHGLSRGRVSQKRAQFHADWLRFHGEEADPRLPLGDGSGLTDRDPSQSVGPLAAAKLPSTACGTPLANNRRY